MRQVAKQEAKEHEAEEKKRREEEERTAVSSLPGPPVWKFWPVHFSYSHLLSLKCVKI